jgi:hypothetical protein
MKLIQKAAALAAMATLLAAGSAEASVIMTSYSISGAANGTFSLAFDNFAGSYSISALNISIGSAQYLRGIPMM